MSEADDMARAMSADYAEITELGAAREIVAELLQTQEYGHTLSRAQSLDTFGKRCRCRWCRAHRFVAGDPPQPLVLKSPGRERRVEELRIAVAKRSAHLDSIRSVALGEPIA